MNKFVTTLMTLLVLAVFSLPLATAQKGMGEATGVARQAVKPPVIQITGILTDIKIGPCENTTGRSPMGVHLIVLDRSDNDLNLHLGPMGALDHVIEQLAVGQSLSAEAFRTERMPEDSYIAKSLMLEDKVIHLRDDNLRPSWAYGGPGRGMGAGQGAGSGQGMGPGRGMRGPCW